VVFIVNFIDRSILGILNQPIKEALSISDSAMGFLGGFAFAVFYTFMGIPIARLADTGVRRNIIAVCLTLWSAMTAFSGLAQNYTQLLLARIGVAVGEAGGSPPAHSMISDFFPPHQRATALAVYALGIPIGAMIGHLAGGWLNEAFNWRIAFFVVGVPGILLAVLVRLTLKEPVRGQWDTEKVSTTPPPLMAVLKKLWQKRSFRYMTVAGALNAFVGYGAGFWVAPLFYRSHGIGTQAMGEALFLLGFAGIAGTFLGGYLSDRYGQRNKSMYLWLPAGVALISVPFAAFSYLWPNSTTALWVYALPYGLMNFYLGPVFALTQTLSGVRGRALGASILLFVLNIVGMGLGPQFVGTASDLFAGQLQLGSESLRWAMVTALAFNILSVVFYLLAASYLRTDLSNNSTES